MVILVCAVLMFVAIFSLIAWAGIEPDDERSLAVENCATRLSSALRAVLVDGESVAAREFAVEALVEYERVMRR